MEPSSVEDGNQQRLPWQIVVASVASMEPSSVEDGNPENASLRIPAQLGFNGAVLS